MRTPAGYEEMIREIARTAEKYGFIFYHDTLKDIPPYHLDGVHKFDLKIHFGCRSDIKEEVPILVSPPTLCGRT